jgi:PilZ domain-containing protein
MPAELAPESDGRRWTRHKIDVRLRVSFVLSDGKTSDAFGRANNLSHGGLGAYIPCSIAVGAVVHAELVFPECSKEVKVKAMVRLCEGFRYGLEFAEVSLEVREMIAKTCGPHRVGG